MGDQPGTHTTEPEATLAGSKPATAILAAIIGACALSWVVLLLPGSGTSSVILAFGVGGVGGVVIGKSVAASGQRRRSARNRDLAATPGEFFVQALGREEGPFRLSHLAVMVNAGQVRGDTLVRAPDGNWFPTRELSALFSEKSWLAALLLSLLVGGLGVDRFYLGKVPTGILKLLTLGGLGLWALIDVILIATGRMTAADGRKLAR